MKSLLLHGNFLHTVNGHFEILEDKWITVTSGKIVSIDDHRVPGDFELIETTPTQFFVPGLIDTHIHAPQYAFLGCGLDLPLLEWLNTYTFPAESKFSDLEHAKRIYNAVVKRTLACGTTTAVYFATIDKNASIILADICRSNGQRAYVGKVSMDRNSPDYYIEKTQEAIENAKQFVDELLSQNSSLNDDLTSPILTPRFVPTCSSELMKGLADIHNENPSLLIQSHVSENLNEIEWVKSLHLDSEHYCGVYESHGLLNSRTILAHGVHLTDNELQLLAKTKSTIAHCPSSNFQLFSGACDVRRLQQANVNVSLGTDAAGGESISMIHSMRNALLCSRAVMFNRRTSNKEDESSQEKVEEYKPLTVPDVLYLATECGAKAVGLENRIGNFTVGKEFDALLVDMNAGISDCFGTEKLTDLLDKFVHQGDDRNVIQVYVRGKLVKQI
ncbi:Amidohydrolase family protein [Tritrichomonas foetus]|uniref:Guanine deaminase n=1 Tax=Tritrichomonas foetus TaxID=1144522 RepID=A0A1J4K342_9EUKA|nr:Amidohydrolase family protein [Tritrichomonas foetus]|eukprot:OHT04142.1 Amidohydrolase family protein [Tritrichomonas foetus]